MSPALSAVLPSSNLRLRLRDLQTTALSPEGFIKNYVVSWTVDLATVPRVSVEILCDIVLEKGSLSEFSRLIVGRNGFGSVTGVSGKVNSRDVPVFLSASGDNTIAYLIFDEVTVNSTTNKQESIFIRLNYEMSDALCVKTDSSATSSGGLDEQVGVPGSWASIVDFVPDVTEYDIFLTSSDVNVTITEADADLEFIPETEEYTSADSSDSVGRYIAYTEDDLQFGFPPREVFFSFNPGLLPAEIALPECQVLKPDSSYYVVAVGIPLFVLCCLGIFALYSRYMNSPERNRYFNYRNQRGGARRRENQETSNPLSFFPGTRDILLVPNTRLENDEPTVQAVLEDNDPMMLFHEAVPTTTTIEVHLRPEDIQIGN